MDFLGMFTAEYLWGQMELLLRLVIACILGMVIGVERKNRNKIAGTNVVSAAWISNEDSIFMKDRLMMSLVPEYDHNYAYKSEGHFMKYVYKINRDALFEDILRVLGAYSKKWKGTGII